MNRTLVLTLMALVLGSAACSDDGDNTGPSTTRMYNQVQRLGNPLVSEVLLSKRSHATHGLDRPPGRCRADRRRDPFLCHWPR